MLLLALAGCLDAGAGYVEIKAFPGFALPLYLDTVKLGDVKNGTAVLRQEVGHSRLQLERNGQFFVLCEFEVKKNRIITLSLTIADRLPRCEVRK